MAQAKRRAAITETPVTSQAVAIYARVSTEDQAERETIDSQLGFLRRFTDLHELSVAGEYIDDGISGRIPLTDRPEGQRLVLDAEAGHFGVVLVYNVKRLGRRLRVVLDAHDVLQRHGVAIRSGTESIDTATTTGKLVFQVLGSFAEYDVDERAEVMSLGRDRVAKQGQYTGGPIPIGYDLDEDKRFVFSERLVEALGITEAEMVRRIFARIANGESTAKAEAARLSALGVPSRKRYGGKAGKTIELAAAWHGTTIQKILHNPIYKGEGVLLSHYGDVARPAPVLIDHDTWQRAQDALLRNRRRSMKNRQHTYLLGSGLIRCANCGSSYVGAATTRVIGGTSCVMRRYRCGGQANHNPGSAAPRCEAKALAADWLEDAVWEECRNFIHNPGDALSEARRKLRQRMAASTRFDDERRNALDQLAAKETERERVLTMYRRGKVDAEEAERELDAIAREAGQLRQDLESMRAQSALVDIQEAQLTESTALLERLREELAEIDASNDLARKREIIEAYVRKITVETDRVGPRKLKADVRVYLRLKPEPIAVESTTLARSR